MAFTLQTVPTPALVIHVPTVERNIARMAAYCREHGLGLRPHTKTHKSVLMARKQVEAGTVGLTVAKVGEAEIMIEADDDILIAYPAFDPARTGRIAALAEHKTMRVAVDSAEAIDALGEAASLNGIIGILVDVDTGFARTGVQTPEQAAALAQRAGSTEGLRFDGLFTFPGHIYKPAEMAAQLAQVDAKLLTAIAAVENVGLECAIVSGGSTPTAYHSHRVTAYTEIRPGTYIYNDRNCAAMGCCNTQDLAAKVIATVVSDAVPGKCVIDGGSKTFTSDLHLGQREMGHGTVEGYEGAVLRRLSEEHGEIDLTACTHGQPKLGERVTVVMNHVCPTVNLQTQVWLDQGDGQLTPMHVDARGKVV